MKTILRRVLNLALYLSFCFMIGSGLLLAYRLIPGSRGGQGLLLWSWNRHDWGDIHLWISYTFIALVIIHMIINWAWLTKVAAQGHFWKLILGILLGIGIISAFLLVPVQRREGGQHQGGPAEKWRKHSGGGDSTKAEGKRH